MWIFKKLEMKNIVIEINNNGRKESLILSLHMFYSCIRYTKLWYIKLYLTLMCIGFYFLLDVSHLKHRKTVHFLMRFGT